MNERSWDREGKEWREIRSEEGKRRV